MTIRIAIVGGGLGGLAAALFLRKMGLDATVYEQDAELREVGAGIVVSPNMVRPLGALGLAHELAAVAVRLEAAWEFRRWEDGRVLSVQPMGEECERLYGAHCYVAHRADLLAMFQQALPASLLRLDHRCVEVDQDAREAELTFVSKFGQKTKVIADVVIGADGIHSIVRQAISPRIDARFSGLCAFRCLVPAEKAPETALRPVQTLWLGPGRHFVHYPISGSRLVNIVAIVPAGAWRTESWMADGEISDLIAEFDAAVLAGCLARADRGSIPQALQRYEKIRRPRTTRVQVMSRGREVRNHLPDGPEQQQRDAKFANDDPLRQSAWLYGYDSEADLLGSL